MTSPLFVLPDLSPLRDVQRSLMTETCVIADLGGTVVIWTDPLTGQTTINIPCRKHQQIADADTADPEDADTRSLANWRFTVPPDVRVETGFRVTFTGNLGETLTGSVGEELDHDTTKIATRFAVTLPKFAVPQLLLTLYRDADDDGTWLALPAQPVRLVFDRLQPEEAEARFSPAAYSAQKGGRLIGNGVDDPEPFDVRVGDRFRYDEGPGVVLAVLEGNPDKIEARFALDIGGV